jgi:photosystem II stability/assembly factor-like uncharacterized protein
VQIAIDPHHPETLFVVAGQLLGTFQATLWRSTDAGETWTISTAGLDGVVASIAVGPSGAAYAAATQDDGEVDAFVSTDSGASWQKRGSLGNNLAVSQLIADPQNRRLLYAAVGPVDATTGFADPRNVLVSRDAGATWQAPPGAPSAQNVQQVLAAPNDAHLFVTLTAQLGEEEAFQRTETAETDWTLLNLDGALDLSHDSVRLSLGAAPGVIDAFDVDSAGAIESHDNGETWGELAIPLVPSGGGVGALAADPSIPGKLDLVERSCHSSDLAGSPTGQTATGCAATLYHSDNSGQSWRQVSTLDPDSGAFPPFGLPILRINPSRPQTVLFGNGSLYESTATRPQLTPLALRGSIIDLAADPSTPAILYAAVVHPHAVFKSNDGGVTWTAASVGLPPGLRATALVVDGLRPSTLYLSGPTGVYVSDNGAATWELLDEGLPGTPVTSLAASTQLPRTVWAGTQGAGVFTLTRP